MVRRAVLTKRAVPVKAQLRSHQLFAQNLEQYCGAVDKASVYSTNRWGGKPEVRIGENRTMLFPPEVMMTLSV